jgi:glyoxylase-like metal-dependent hydrolase (beta-lactamase superfamily II)
VPDSHFTADGAPVTEGIMSATRPLKPQLAEAGYTPADITHLAMSHYHSDHTANANDFAGATWIVQKAERDFMLADTPQGIIQPDHYSALRTARTRILDNEDLDVFGDGTVVIKPAYGHTPGHNVLFLKLAQTGPLVLSGDLYHYPEEVTTGVVPHIDYNKDRTRESRKVVDDLMKATGAKLWVQHDLVHFRTLKKSPEFYE